MEKILYIYKTRLSNDDDFNLISWSICDRLSRILGFNGVITLDYFIIDSKIKNLSDRIFFQKCVRPIFLDYIDCFKVSERDDKDTFKMSVNISIQFGKFNEILVFHKEIDEKLFELGLWSGHAIM